MNERTVSMRLELRVVEDCMVGRIWNGSAEAVEFSGWLGLVATIDALVSDHEPEEKR